MEENATGFPATRWSCVLALGDEDDAVRRRALNELLVLYRPALLHFLVAVKRTPREQAEDLVQAFLEERVLRGGLLARAQINQGRLRSFLLRSFSNFIASQHRKNSAAKRSPTTGPMLCLDDAPEEDVATYRHPAEMDEAWARQTLAMAINAFRLECADSGKSAWWDVFEARLLAPLLGEGTAYSFDDLAAKHGFNKPQDAANVLVSAKRAFGRQLRSIVADTIAESADVDDEVRALIEALSRCGKGDS